MATRYRWYRIQLPHSSEDLANLVAKSPFLEESPFGFARIESSADVPKFRFLWRSTLVVTRLDEDGSPAYEEIANVSFTDFAVINFGALNVLRVENPGRTVRDLLNAIESLVGLGFTAKPMTFEGLKPAALFDDIDVSKLVGLKVVGAVIDEDLVARMDFVSKDGMDVKSMKVLSGLKYKVDTAVFSISSEGVRGQVTLTATGTVKVSGQLSGKLVQLIERHLSTVN